MAFQVFIPLTLHGIAHEDGRPGLYKNSRVAFPVDGSLNDKLGQPEYPHELEAGGLALYLHKLFGGSPQKLSCSLIRTEQLGGVSIRLLGTEKHGFFASAPK